MKNNCIYLLVLDTLNLTYIIYMYCKGIHLPVRLAEHSSSSLLGYLTKSYYGHKESVDTLYTVLVG
jgi:hypothetical protein